MEAILRGSDAVVVGEQHRQHGDRQGGGLVLGPKELPASLFAFALRTSLAPPPPRLSPIHYCPADGNVTSRSNSTEWATASAAAMSCTLNPDDDKLLPICEPSGG